MSHVIGIDLGGSVTGAGDLLLGKADVSVR